MRMMLFVLAALVAFVGDVRPSVAHGWYPWFPWCARYADRSGITECSFVTFQQCLATVSGIGGFCMQNWYPPPPAPRRAPHWKNFYR